MHDDFRALLSRYKSYQSVAPCAHCSSGTLFVKFQRIYRCSVRFILQVLIFFHQFDRLSSTLWITNTPVIPLPLNYIQCSVFIQRRQQKEVPPARQRLDESQVLEQVLFFPYLKFYLFCCCNVFQIGWPCDGSVYLKEDFLFYKWWWFLSIDFFAPLSSKLFDEWLYSKNQWAMMHVYSCFHVSCFKYLRGHGVWGIIKGAMQWVAGLVQ